MDRSAEFRMRTYRKNLNIKHLLLPMIDSRPDDDSCSIASTTSTMSRDRSLDQTTRGLNRHF